MSGILFEGTAIPGLVVIRPQVSRDARGTFAKTFVAAEFAAQGLATTFIEEYHTASMRGSVRGMHFQLPPHDHDKTVFCTSGAAFDVVLDLRVGSPTFGVAQTFELSGPCGQGLYIPTGCAHGFCALSDDTVMTYSVTTLYSPDSDAGVLWSSAPVKWPCVDPIVSERDGLFPALADFQSPFTFNARTF